MPSEFSTRLRLELQATGENRSTWGQKANTVFELVDEAVAGLTTVAIPNADVVLSDLAGVSCQARHMMLNFTGTLTQNRSVTIPARSKIYFVANNTVGGFSVVLTVGSSSYALASGQRKLIYTDGITIFTNDTLATPSSQTTRWGIPALIKPEGGTGQDLAGSMDIGRYIDFHNANVDSSDYAVRLETNGTTIDLYLRAGSPVAGPFKLWHAGNDGPSSALDADTVDGQHASALTFAPGTVMLFAQTAAPTGWVKLTTHNDKALRVVSGTVGSGGSMAFSAAFTGRTSAGTVLTVANLPIHSHTVSGTTGGESVEHTHTVSGTTGAAGGHSHGYSDWTVGGAPGFLESGAEYSHSGINRTTDAVGNHSHSFSATSSGRSAGHTHSFSATSGNTGTGTAHTHTLDMTVQYVDVILAAKL